MPHRVRLVVLVIVVALFLFGAAGNEIPASSEELTSSAAMAPPWSASAQASAPPPFFLSRPIGFQRPRLHTPSGLCNRSTVDHGRGPRALGRPVHACRGGPSQSRHDTWPPRRPATRSAADRRKFCTLTPLFQANQPAVQPSSKVFLFNPVLLNNSARSPDPLEIQF